MGEEIEDTEAATLDGDAPEGEAAPQRKPAEKKAEPGLLKAPRPLEEDKPPETPERFGLLKMPRLLEG